MSYKYYCNCCGYDFYEEEGAATDGFVEMIRCLNCGAERYSNEDDYIIEEITE